MDMSDNAANVSNNVGALCGGIGSITVMFFIFRYSALRRTISSRLIFFQTCCYLLEAIFGVAMPWRVHSYCVLQAAVVAYVRQAGMLWAGVMVLVVYNMMRKPGGRMPYKPSSQLLLFHLVCWISPLPIVLPPLFTG